MSEREGFAAGNQVASQTEAVVRDTATSVAGNEPERESHASTQGEPELTSAGTSADGAGVPPDGSHLFAASGNDLNFDGKAAAFSPKGLTVRLAHPHEVGWMLHEHYLDKWPAVSTAIIALCRDDHPVGCIVFAVPPRETIQRYGDETWELARLWVADSEPRNTESWFIARTVKLIRQTCPSIRYLVSYADPSVGHIGTIYKAANWTYDGHTDAERKTARHDYLCDGKHYSRRSHLPPGRPFERVPRVSKPRYVLDLGKRRRSRLNLGRGVAGQVYDPFGTTPLSILDDLIAAEGRRG